MPPEHRVGFHDQEHLAAPATIEHSGQDREDRPVSLGEVDPVDLALQNEDLMAYGQDLGVALASLTEAYEMLDESTGDRVEQELFRPVQMAYGRAKRTHAEFAERHQLVGREFEAPVLVAIERTVFGTVTIPAVELGAAVGSERRCARRTALMLG